MVQSPVQVGVGIACAGLAAISYAISVVSPHWAHTRWEREPSQIVHVDFGLTKWITESVEHDYKEKGELKTVRILQIVGLLGAIACWGLGALVILFQHDRQSTIKFNTIAFVIVLATDAMAVLGFFIFHEGSTKNFGRQYGADVSLGFSFYLAAVSCVLGLVGGFLIFNGGNEKPTCGPLPSARRPFHPADKWDGAIY